MIKDLITSVVKSTGIFPLALLCAPLGSWDLSFSFETLPMAVRNPEDKAFKVIGQYSLHKAALASNCEGVEVDAQLVLIKYLCISRWNLRIIFLLK